MTDADQSNATRLPILKMAGLGVSASVLIALVGGVIGGSLPDALWTLAPMLVSIPATLLMLNALGARPAPAWAAPVLAGTVLRAAVALGIGTALFLGAGLDRYIFFLTLVSALVAVLAIDVALTVAMIHKHAPRDAGGAIAEGA